MALPGRANLRKAIREHGGAIADVARHFDVTRQTVYNWLDHYDLRAEVEAARTSMRMVAQDVIYQRLMNADEDKAFDAAKFVMLNMSDDGNLLPLSPRVVALLRRMGASVGTVIAEFEAIIEQMAMEQLPDVIEMPDDD